MPSALRRMKRGAVLVNTARGPVIDPTALSDALRDGDIVAAGLDVTDPEPMPASTTRWSSLANCLVVPHVASASGRRATRWPRWPPGTSWPGCEVSGSRRPVNPEVYERVQRPSTSLPVHLQE